MALLKNGVSGLLFLSRTRRALYIFSVFLMNLSIYSSLRYFIITAIWAVENTFSLGFIKLDTVVLASSLTAKATPEIDLTSASVSWRWGSTWNYRFSFLTCGESCCCSTGGAFTCSSGAYSCAKVASTSFSSSSWSNSPPSFSNSWVPSSVNLTGGSTSFLLADYRPEESCCALGAGPRFSPMAPRSSKLL